LSDDGLNRFRLVVTEGQRKILWCDGCRSKPTLPWVVRNV